MIHERQVCNCHRVSEWAESRFRYPCVHTMTKSQRAFWLVIVVHFLLAAFVAVNALPYLREIPFWFLVLAIAVGAAGGMLRAAQASVVHRVHRPNMVRGITEGLIVGLIVYAVAREVAEVSPRITATVLVGIMAALPVWLIAYVGYMLLGTSASGERQTTRN